MKNDKPVSVNDGFKALVVTMATLEKKNIELSTKVDRLTKANGHLSDKVRALEIVVIENHTVNLEPKNAPTPTVDPVLQTYIDNGYTPEYDSEGNWTGRVSYRSADTKTNEPTPKTDVREAVESMMGVAENLTASGLLNQKAKDALIERFGGTRSKYYAISKKVQDGQ